MSCTEQWKILQKSSIFDVVMPCPFRIRSINRVVSSATAAHGFGKRSAVGVTSYNTENETFWFCMDCGKRFRDLDELQALVPVYLKKARVGRILMIVFAAYTAFMLLCSPYVPGPLTAFCLILLLGMTALSYMIMRSWQRKARETQAEYEELSARVWVDE